MALYNIKISNGYTEKYYSNQNNQIDDFPLAKIDNITSKTKDEKTFIQNYIFKTFPCFNTKKVWISKKTNQEQTKQMIYDDIFITNISEYVLKNNIYTLDKNLIIDFVNELKNCILDEEIFESMKNCNYISLKLKLELENYRRLKNRDILNNDLMQELSEIEKNIIKYMSSYSILRDIRAWELYYIKNQNQQLEAEYNYLNDNFYEKSISTYVDNEIKDNYIKNLYEKYEGDIEMLIEIVGADRLEELSEHDQQLIGYKDYQGRNR